MIGFMQDPLDEMLDLARQLGLEAAEQTRPYSGRVDSMLKADSSVVTEVDHEVQRRIVSAVSGRFPEHAFMNEEPLDDPASHPEPGSARFCWVVDPIDGTRNFVAGFACFATSIAVVDRGVPVVGVVVEHNVNHVYAARAGGGATLNGRRLRMEEPDPERDVIVGISSGKDPHTCAVSARWQGEPGLVTRNLGSSALHLGMLASGAFGAVFNRKCKIWDIAAGIVLVREAGGVVTDPEGREVLPFDMRADPGRNIPIFGAAPEAHGKLLQGVRAAAGSRLPVDR